MRRVRIRVFVFVLFFMMFVFLMDYPYLSRIYNDMISGEVIDSYETGEKDEDCSERLKWAIAYNRYLAGEGEHPHEQDLVKPSITEENPEEPSQEELSKGESNLEELSQGESSQEEPSQGELSQGESNQEEPIRENQEQAESDSDSWERGEGSEWEMTEGSEWERAAHILCVDDSDQAGWIRINSLDLMLPLYIGTGDQALRKGAGILEKSSLPVGGESTHTCISAHRGLPDRTLFTNLDLMKKGDQILLHTLDQTIAYVMIDSETVLPDDTKHLQIQKGEDLLTLITCTPYGINTHRLYIHARRCDYTPAEDEESLLLKRDITDILFWKLWWWIPASILLILFMIILVRRYLRRACP